MQLVVDANVLLAAFLKSAKTRELLLDERLTLLAPEHLISEVSHHLQEFSSLRRRIQLSNEQLQELFNLLTMRIQTIPKQAYQLHMKTGITIAPHAKDAPYLAVALLYRLAIWSNDKGIKDQTLIKVYSTRELITVLSRTTQ